MVSLSWRVEGNEEEWRMMGMARVNHADDGVDGYVRWKRMEGRNGMLEGEAGDGEADVDDVGDAVGDGSGDGNGRDGRGEDGRDDGPA